MGYVLPTLLDKYGLAPAILLSLVVVLGMGMHYLRGYWIERSLSKNGKEADHSGMT